MASIRQEECPLEKGKTEDKRDVLSNINRLQKSGGKRAVELSDKFNKFLRTQSKNKEVKVRKWKIYSEY